MLTVSVPMSGLGESANVSRSRSKASVVFGASRWPASVRTISLGRRRKSGAPEPLLEQLDLVAHRRLGHPQLFRGTGKTEAPGDGFEDADGGERR